MSLQTFPSALCIYLNFRDGERDVLVSVAVCLEEDALVSVFSLQEVKHEVSSLEEVDWKGLMCVCLCLCATFISVYLYVWSVLSGVFFHNECLLYIPPCSCHRAWSSERC